jgi:type I restriction enzyme M protein
MAIAHNIGHNKNGKPTYRMENNGALIYDQKGQKIIDDDLPAITDNFIRHLNGKFDDRDHLGFSIDYQVLNDHIFIPEYYNPEIKAELEKLKKSGKYDLISVGDLINKKVLHIKRGNEIGSQFYGTGDIPFVRTSDIVNWEIKVDPVKAVSQEIYDQYKKSQDVQENDILFVNDGTFLIGRTALITKLDLKIIIQSHVRKIRVIDKDFIDPFYLFYLLNSKIVRKQIDSKTFVQATISTIGSRLDEVILPVSKNTKEIKKISSEMADLIYQKALLREKAQKIVEESV